MLFLITNENLSTYDKIYHFEGKDILSVVGSGDQYFVSKLCGAKKVDLFDYSKKSWNVFVLKFMALRYFSYEDFFRYIISGQLSDTKTYERLRNFLPTDVRDFFDSNYKFFYTNELVPLCASYYRGPAYGDGSIIPYFNEANYYKLQDILTKEELPTYYCENIMCLPGIVKWPYDIMLTSNIYAWLVDDKEINDPDQYKYLLDQLPAKVIQAHYMWDKCDDDDDRFTDFGYQETVVPTVNRRYFDNNFVYTYTKRKDIGIPKKITS
jgi:hypothetical protein